MDITSFLYAAFSEYGVFSIIAPFLLIFSLMYGLLRKTGIFGRDNPAREKLYAVVSFALAAYYIYNLQAVIFTENFISFFFFEFLVLFFILMVIGLLSLVSRPYDPKDEAFNRYKGYANNAITGILGLLVLFAFMYASSVSFDEFGQTAAGALLTILDFLINTGLLPLIIVIGLLIAVVAWVTKPPQPKKPKKKYKYIILAPGEAVYDLYESAGKKK
ncbi:MAG: hypothetical protein ACP5G1_00655 [Nanopusillaceae archaeon]